MTLPPRTGPRLERKRLIDPRQVSDLISFLESRYHPDPHASDPEDPKILIDTLYLDTPGYASIPGGNGIQLPKHRLRRYDGEGDIWIEEKLRRGDRVWKRRIPIPEIDLDPVLVGGEPLSGFAEGFRTRFRVLDLKPTLWVTYQRRAFVGAEGERITIDESARAAIADVNGNGFSPTVPAVDISTEAILELKGPLEVEKQLDLIDEKVVARGRRFSKYRRGLDLLGLIDSGRS